MPNLSYAHEVKFAIGKCVRHPKSFSFGLKLWLLMMNQIDKMKDNNHHYLKLYYSWMQEEIKNISFRIQLTLEYNQNHQPLIQAS